MLYLTTLIEDNNHNGTFLLGNVAEGLRPLAEAQTPAVQYVAAMALHRLCT